LRLHALEAPSPVPAVDARPRGLRRAAQGGVEGGARVRRAGSIRVRGGAAGSELALRPARADLVARAGDGGVQPVARGPLPRGGRARAVEWAPRWRGLIAGARSRSSSARSVTSMCADTC